MESVAPTLELLDRVIEKARSADFSGNASAATSYLSLAHEMSVTAFETDVWIARMAQDYPNDWRFKWPKDK